jgi:hypothetical protein
MPTIASQADPHRLYELAVQNPAAEIDFIDRTYYRLRGRRARLLREDFCGTGAICCEWVRRRATNRACGLDLDPTVLDWSHRNRIPALSAHQRTRIGLIEQDVLNATTGAQDIVLALNFSYWLLRERSALLHYFRQVMSTIKDDGLFVLDAYGGYDAYRRLNEERRVNEPLSGDFTYVWEQADYDPITGRLLCHIHFRFDDGSSLDRAFTYDWRLWTLPEICELLSDAGFSRTQVYWQDWDAEGNPDGVFLPVDVGQPDAGWIAYLIAEKG